MFARAAAAVIGATLLAGCVSSASPQPTTTTTRTSTVTRSSSPDSKPISTGPTHAAAAASCPFAAPDFVRDTIGMRLGRITVLRSGGRTVGCRFYALQNSPLHNSEHLPGPNQPAVEIVTQRFASATAAHNSFVLLASTGKNAQQIDLGRVVGVCFQTDFYPKDHGTDWACAASVGRTEIVVRTVDTTGTFSTAAVMRAVLRHA
jgi:hypothetical protein